jgi:hypothetical protein
VLVRVPLSFLFGRQRKAADLYSALLSALRHPFDHRAGRLFGKMKCRAVHGGVIALIVLFSAILLGLVIIQATGIGGFIPYVHTWKTLAAAAALAGLVSLSAHRAETNDGRRENAAGRPGNGDLLSTIQLVLPDDTIEHKAPGALLLRNASRVQPETVLVSLEDPLRAVCWFYKRSDVFQLGGGGELAYGMAYPDGRHRLLDEAQFARPGKRPCTRPGGSGRKVQALSQVEKKAAAAGFRGSSGPVMCSPSTVEKGRYLR